MLYVVSCLLLVSSACFFNAVALDVHEALQTQNGRIDARGKNPTFMIVGGISAGQEMCLSVENGSVDTEGSEVVLEPCIDTVAAGDGRELWRFGSHDQIVNILGGKCMGLKENVVADGGHVVLVNCDAAAGSKDGRSQWTLEANNQLTSGHSGQYCLSQRGASPGVENVAAKAAVMASSNVDAVAHGANMAVDGKDGTYWASKFDISEPVTFTIDFGGRKKLQSASISWEFPAKSFDILTTEDGEHWVEAFSTNNNALKTTRVALPFQYATKVRLIMHEPHAIYGRFQGHVVYGITSVSLYASRLRSVVDACAIAGKSGDARDKYFLSYVGEFDPYPSKALRSEMPSVEAAKTSMAATIGELTDVLPSLASCRKAGARLFSDTTRVNQPISMSPLVPEVERYRSVESFKDESLARSVVTTKPQTVGASVESALSRLSKLVEAQNGIDAESMVFLMREGRHAIIEARKALK